MAKLVWVWNEMSKEMKWNQNAMMSISHLKNVRSKVWSDLKKKKKTLMHYLELY
jgi:hypothetical protein